MLSLGNFRDGKSDHGKSNIRNLINYVFINLPSSLYLFHWHDGQNTTFSPWLSGWRPWRTARPPWSRRGGGWWGRWGPSVEYICLTKDARVKIISVFLGWSISIRLYDSTFRRTDWLTGGLTDWQTVKPYLMWNPSNYAKSTRIFMKLWL